MEDPVHQSWSSKAAFLLASTGAAVGLGNLWRFPYLVGAHGGAAFVLVYVGTVLLICIPLATAEIALGRMGHMSPIESMRTVARKHGAGHFWAAIGYLSVIVPFVGLTYYSIVAGWAVHYVLKGVTDSFAGVTADQSLAIFSGLAASPWASIGFQGFVILSTAWIVGRGLHGGIERATRVMMPGLFLILLLMIGYNMAAADMKQAVVFLFAPDFSKLTTASLMLALGQAFFSVGVGVGYLITYGAYLDEKVSIPRSAAVIAAVDTLVALLAGLAIFPIVFASGLSPAEGPGLVFVSMPVAFGTMPLGRLIAVLFFLLLFLAAFTSTIGMLEPAVSVMEEKWRGRRLGLSFMTAALIWLIGILPALSGSLFRDVHPLWFVTALAQRSVFEVFDLFTGSILIPVNGFLIAVFAGWVLGGRAFESELGLGESWHRAWHFLVKVIAPLAIVAVTVQGLGG